MSQRDMLEVWRILVNGAATSAIQVANRTTAAIIRRREARSPSAAERVTEDRPSVETTPASKPPPHDDHDRE